jgi:hypothetical protein
MNLTLRSKQHQGLVLFRQGKVVQKLEKTRSQINSIQSFQAIPKKTQQNAPNCSVDGQNTLEMNHASPCTLSAAY